VIISESLKNFALDKEIELLNFRWADEVLEAICKDKISAAVGTPALAVAINHYAGGKVLYPPADLWPNNPSYGIVVEKSFLRKENALVERFLVLHEESESFLRNNTDNASRFIAETVGVIDEIFVRETLALSPKYCAYITEEYISSTMAFVSALTKLGYINKRITPEEIFDTSLINKIHTEKDHYESGISVK
jgi:NitT/TauT family transport system substrate-binding protein